MDIRKTQALRGILKDASLLKDKCYIGGNWISGAATIDVTNPVDDSVIGSVPKLGAAETRQALSTPWAVIWQAFALVFVAELGDRTQFATIFLATAPAKVFSFGGLLAGTLVGHGLVTWLAVGAGKWIGRRVDERLLYRLSGGLFLVFGLAALHQALA